MSNENMKKKEEIIEIAEDWKVFISNNAFRKMLCHVLRFANDSLDEYQEAMGICIGEVNSGDETMDLMNIIPLSHGDLAELGFTQETHEKIKQIGENVTSTNLKILGWYHSRLKGGFFLSHADKSNQLYFQNEKNPYGFIIIFDCNLLDAENNFGLEIFRLKKYSKGIDSEYIKVPFEVEIPKTLNFFKWIKELVEDNQRKTPIIINEFDEIRKPTIEELEEIPKNKIAISSDEVEFNEQIEPIFSGFREGTYKFAESFMDAYKQQLSGWMTDIRDGSLKGTEYIRSTVNQMKNSIEKGLEDIQNYFDRSFTEISNVFAKNISDYIDRRIKSQKEFTLNVSKLFEKITEDIRVIIEKNLQELINNLKEKMSYEEVKLYNITQLDAKTTPLVAKSSNLITEVYKNTNSLSENMVNEIKILSSRFNSNLNKEIEDLNLDSNPIREKYKEIEDLIERLQKVISDFRQLK
ncbi:MAG: hypothetical protein ACFE8V_08800 [Promethearchaeota archaeon]